MKSFKVAVLVLVCGAMASSANKNVFLGEISDSQCAMNVHSLSRSHQEMIKKSTLGTDAASCARACIRRGGEWVLRVGDDVYRLKNQPGIELYAGEKVQITGTLDAKAKEIDNTAIEILPVKGHAASVAGESREIVH
jgi:hypothetical protein